MVLVPAATQLTGKRVVVVSDGALQYLPFSLLPSPDRIGTRPASGKTDHTQFTPLIAEHEVVNLPSVSVLAVLRQEIAGRKPPPRTVAVLADPVFDLNDTRVASAKVLQNDSGRQDAKQTAFSSQNSGEQNNSALASLESPSAETRSPTRNLTRSAVDVGLSTDGSLYLPRLLSSRREAKAILSAVPAGQGMEALDFKANRIMATSPDLAQYRIVHIATHGLLDSEHPEFSGLVLSLVDEHGKQQNGFLELQDIYNLNLPVDMVVLSACETGLGKEVDGEGLIGLTRGFMYAGSPRVVASLWKVDDAATAELMSRFYRAMVQDGLRLAAALRRAQIEMWKQERWTSPFNWAGFQMQGEWE
jgi:CHAT domain-containing protein